MRLLHRQQDGRFSLVERLGAEIPPYAILSHTWGPDDEEVSFRDIVDGKGQHKSGFRKLTFCCNRAAHDGLLYFWIDTCCIDKSSSAELTESINSMFRWYQASTRCYVYLPDVSVDTARLDTGSHSAGEPVDNWMLSFKRSRWFTRGWTLQELIAPRHVEFFAKDEHRLGDKHSLAEAISDITGISINALDGKNLSNYSVVDRMKWADRRRTKREEDLAYSLLGIFDVYMPLIYGEGRQNSLFRLQKAIEEKEGSQHVLRSRARELHNVENLERQNSMPSEMRNTILDTLTFKQIDARLLTLKSAQTKTCRWLLKNRFYKDWANVAKLREHHGFFWIKGKPGTGKSVMMKFLFADAKKSMKDSLVLSFFFNARGEALEKSTIGLYRALLVQLLEKAPETGIILDDLGMSHAESVRNTGWQLEALQDLILRALQQLEQRRVVCFVDALDECPEDDVRDMVSFFEELGELENGLEFRVCFASRHYPEISIRTGLQLVLEFEPDHSNDISLFIDTNLKIGNDTQAEDIKAEILQKCSGIFLWVSLVIPMLNKEYDRGRIKALKKRLSQIPSGLHDLFLDMVTRDKNNVDELLNCIMAILLAGRPLRPEELRVIVETICDEEFELEPYESTLLTAENLRKFVLDASKGLAEITKSKIPTVQFIHESVRDFLTLEGGVRRIVPRMANFEGLGHDNLKRVCFLHLSHSVLTAVGSKSQVASYPLVDYALQFLFHHADLAQSHHISQTDFMRSLDDPSMSKVIFFRLLRIRRMQPEKHPDLVANAAIGFLAEYGAAHLIKTYAENIESTDISKVGVLPLMRAMFAGQHAAARALLGLAFSTTGRAEIRGFQNDQEFKTTIEPSFDTSKLIFSACEYGDTDVLRSIFKTEEIALDFETVMSCFGHASSESIVDLLAELGACEVLASTEQFPPKTWKPGKSARAGELPHAAKITYAPSIKHFVLAVEEYRILKDKTWTQWPRQNHLILYAAERGFQQIFQYLSDSMSPALRKDVFRSAICGRRNPRGRIAIMKRLLEADIDTDIPLQTELLNWYIVRPHNEEIVELALSSSLFDLEARDRRGITPLLLSIRRGRKGYVKMFLEAGANPMTGRKRDGADALMHTVMYCDMSSFKLILHSGRYDVQSRDKLGRSVLSWCAMVADNVAREMANLFIMKFGEHTKLDSVERSGQTALMRAVRSGNLDMVSELISHPQVDIRMPWYGSIDPDLAHPGRSTPLRLAIKLYQEERTTNFLYIAERLLQSGRVDPHNSNKLPTPAQMIQQENLTELVPLLRTYQACMRTAGNYTLKDHSGSEHSRNEHTDASETIWRLEWERCTREGLDKTGNRGVLSRLYRGRR